MADTVETLDEDPTAFLVRMEGLCPDVLFMLGNKQATLLSENPTDPYDPKNVNEQYLSEMGALYDLKHLYNTGRNALCSSVLKPSDKTKQLDIANFGVKKDTVEKVCFQK